MNAGLAAVLVTLAMFAAAITVVALVMRHKRQLRELLSAMWAVSGAALAVCGLCLTAASFSLAWQGVVVFAAATTALSTEVTLQGLEASGT